MIDLGIIGVETRAMNLLERPIREMLAAISRAL